MHESLYDFCRRNGRSGLLDQWDTERNAPPLTPRQVTAGTMRKVWWQYPLGHTWKAFAYSRTGAQRCGCPVCGGMTRAAKR